MRKIIYWLQDQLDQVFFVDPENYRGILLRFFRLIGIPVLVIFTISDIYRGTIVETVLTVITLIFFVFSKKLAEKEKFEISVYRIGLGLLILNVSFTLFSPLNLSYSAFITFLLPIPIVFLLGSLEGTMWNLFAFTFFILMIVLSPNHEFESSFFLLRYGLTYIVLSLLAFISEIVRFRAHQLFLEKQAELEQNNQEIYHRSIRDPLTGFYNRVFFTDAFEDVISQALRAKLPIIIILLDLDNFKSINDQCGHMVGDDTLGAVGDVIRGNLKRKSDFVIRYGGDEFLIALFDITPVRAKMLASQIVDGIRKIRLPGCDNSVQASVGLVNLNQLENQQVDIADLIRQLISTADKNMYRAKTLGGNLVVDEIKLDF